MDGFASANCVRPPTISWFPWATAWAASGAAPLLPPGGEVAEGQNLTGQDVKLNKGVLVAGRVSDAVSGDGEWKGEAGVVGLVPGNGRPHWDWNGWDRSGRKLPQAHAGQGSSTVYLGGFVPAMNVRRSTGSFGFREPGKAPKSCETLSCNGKAPVDPVAGQVIGSDGKPAVAGRMSRMVWGGDLGIRLCNNRCRGALQDRTSVTGAGGAMDLRQG